MPQQVRRQAEEVLGHMDTALLEVARRAERIVAAFGDCDTTNFIGAMREAHAILGSRSPGRPERLDPSFARSARQVGME